MEGWHTFKLPSPSSSVYIHFTFVFNCDFMESEIGMGLVTKNHGTQSHHTKT